MRSHTIILILLFGIIIGINNGTQNENIKFITFLILLVGFGLLLAWNEKLYEDKRK